MGEVWRDYCFMWRHYPFEMGFTAIVAGGIALFIGATVMWLALR